MLGQTLGSTSPEELGWVDEDALDRGLPSAAAPPGGLPALSSFPASPPTVWFYFGVVGSFLFILIQLLLFIDFAHSWNQRWLSKAEECDSRAWYAGQCCPDPASCGRD